MRLRFTVRTQLVIVALIAALLVLGSRAWNSEWASLYASRHAHLVTEVSAIRGLESSLRAQGQVAMADKFRAMIPDVERRRNEMWWRWLKALVLDES
jgi:hypothetical protein